MLRGLIAVAVLVFAASAQAQAQDLYPLPRQPAGVAWPGEDWEAAPLPADVDRAAYDLAVTEAFAGIHPLMGETRAVVVIQGGRVVFERYGDGYTRDTRLNSWSVGKSLTHALVGAAVLQGRLGIDAPMGNPAWRAGDRRASITWRQWMQMVDGLDYREGAEDISQAGNAIMLFGDGRRDVARWAASRRLMHDPGTHWNYTSAGTMLTADALTRVVVPDPSDVNDRRARMRAWMSTALFDRIGMHPIVEFDPQGCHQFSDLSIDRADPAEVVVMLGNLQHPLAGNRFATQDIFEKRNDVIAFFGAAEGNDQNRVIRFRHGGLSRCEANWTRCTTTKTSLPGGTTA